MLTRIKMKALNFNLRLLDGTRYQIMLKRLVFRQVKTCHQGRDPVAAKKPHNLILKRNKKARGTRITLPSRAAAELVVDAPRFMALGTNHIQSSQCDHFIMRGFPSSLLPLIIFGI